MIVAPVILLIAEARLVRIIAANRVYLADSHTFAVVSLRNDRFARGVQQFQTAYFLTLTHIYAERLHTVFFVTNDQPGQVR